MRESPIVTDLPISLLREIGRVTVTYANLEDRLSKVIYLLLDIDPKRGRLAVREPRATDRLEVIRDLMQLSNITVSIDMQNLAANMSRIQRERDQLAHGIWVRESVTKKTYLRLIKGSWQPIKGLRGKTSRRVTPQGIIFGVDECRELVRSIADTAEAIEHLGYQIDASLQSSRKTPNGQHPRADRHQGHTRATFRPLLGSPPMRAPRHKE